MVNKKRMLYLAVSIFLGTALLYSALMIGLHSHHDCSGDDCPICAVIHRCEQLLSSAASGGGEAALITAFVCSAPMICAAAGFVLPRHDPVVLKIRLLD